MICVDTYAHKYVVYEDMGDTDLLTAVTQRDGEGLDYRPDARGPRLDVSLAELSWL